MCVMGVADVCYVGVHVCYGCGGMCVHFMHFSSCLVKLSYFLCHRSCVVLGRWGLW